MELTTSWKEQGRQEERLELALRLLNRRCGPLSSAMESMVRGLTPPQLQELAEALLDFSGSSDLEHWIRTR